MTDRKKRIAAAVGIATAMAIPMEGLRQWAYYDPPGILTVCFGSTTNVVKGKKYSLEECRQRLDVDMLMAVEQVDQCVPGLPVPTLAAFGDAVYNLGPKIACDKTKSTAARLLASKQIEKACKELPKWNKANVGGVMVALPGLTKRRNAEMALCLEGVQG